METVPSTGRETRVHQYAVLEKEAYGLCRLVGSRWEGDSHSTPQHRETQALPDEKAGAGDSLPAYNPENYQERNPRLRFLSGLCQNRKTRLHG